MTFQLISQLFWPDNPWRVLVLGDVILDRYVTGEAERVSPEAPVVVLRCDSQDVRLGGAGSAAFQLQCMGAETVLVSVTGADTQRQTLRQLCDESGIEAFLIGDESRPTTSKERLLGKACHRTGQQMLRVDCESREPISGAICDALSAEVLSRLAGFDAVLISDYGKGVCQKNLVQMVIQAARELTVPVVVDPARGADLSSFQGATILKANRDEAGTAAGFELSIPSEALAAAHRIQQLSGVSHVVVTLDSDGCVSVSEETHESRFGTRKRNVSDITGAGDTFAAVLTLGAAGNITLEDLLPLANTAAGLQVETIGVTAVTRDDIQRADNRAAGEVTLAEAASLAGQYRSTGHRVVLTNGCFDLLHAGHVRCLQEAAAQGDVLFVAINSDQSVRQLKGENRPFYRQSDRVTLLSALACVNHVLVFEEDTPHKLLREIRPAVLVKGGTYSTEEVVGREVVLGYGGEIHVTGEVPDRSTSRLVSRIQQKEPGHVATHSH